MRQSILTKFIAPSDTKGARIKAVQSGWGNPQGCVSVTIGYPYELNEENAHKEAAMQLANKLGWKGRFIAGSLGAQSTFSYVFVPDDQDVEFTL